MSCLPRSIVRVALLLVAAASASMPASVPARADDMPVIKVEMRDGAIIPTVIEVPANTRFKLEISNTGQTPVEFESTELRREKALAAGSTSAIVFRTLDAGTYQVFDDFHPEAKATLVAK
ncbi:cupredoxin domain-containing protein [Methylobacterium oryzae]|uniref:EfeO-type cupredoxin-like domain-containing protein n=1 Tax=Methylobacterium oryzae TaxID=334852 RepID=A0ABU7TYH9_9HYPH